MCTIIVDGYRINRKVLFLDQELRKKNSLCANAMTRCCHLQGQLEVCHSKLNSVSDVMYMK